MKHIILTLILMVMFSPKAYTQELGNNDAPVEISANGTLEWNQKAKQYIARDAVEAKQGDVVITSDLLVADYYDSEDPQNKSGSVEIWQITATGNVTIKNADSVAFGDKGVYDVNSGVATLTGGALKLTTPDQTLTASQKMTYDSQGGKASAVGNAKIVDGTDTLTASQIDATFDKDANGKQRLKTATATGGVTIKTPDETIIGDKGIYNAQDNTAQVMGNVKITRGPNVLEGDKAEVNLTTNVSKMFAAPNKGQRVKGVFFPSSK